MRIHYLQHVPHEGPGFIEGWANQRNYPLTATKLYEGDPFPEMTDFDLLVIMGGPMSVLDVDKFPWLQDELSFVVHAIADGKKVLGICLGAQLIAYLLGAKIKKSPNIEIGWFPVSKTTNHSMFSDIPDEFFAFHWHGEMFEVPAGAEGIFCSGGCENQGFIYYDKVVGFQFHFETTPASIDEMLAADNIDNLKGDFIQTSEKIRSMEEYSKTVNGYLAQILDKLAENS